MKKIIFPHVNLPQEFLTLLKMNLSVSSPAALVLQEIKPNKALYSILNTAFLEFDPKGLDKVVPALGWHNFRERMASIYLYKTIYGDFPSTTKMELVEDIKLIENRFRSHSVNSYSRLFLLGFYLKLANMKIQSMTENDLMELEIPGEIETFLQYSEGRSEKIDWLILILIHLRMALGEQILIDCLKAGKKIREIYQLMPSYAQELMAQNLLAYGASIQEQDFFLYEKV
jgi:hypothetical protein